MSAFFTGVVPGDAGEAGRFRASWHGCGEADVGGTSSTGSVGALAASPVAATAAGAGFAARTAGLSSPVATEVGPFDGPGGMGASDSSLDGGCGGSLS